MSDQEPREIPENVLQAMEDLPALPQVASAAVDVLKSPDTNAGQISEILEKDPVIVGNCLRLLNSAAYALRRNIESIEEAVVLLGFRSVLNVVTTASLVSSFRKISRENDLRWFWEHSIGSAVIGRRIANLTGYSKPELVYMAALLHDIGLLPLIISSSEKWKNAVQYSGQAGIPLTDAEQEFVDIDHPTVGAALLHNWGVAEPLVEVARHHHKPVYASRENEALVSLVAMSDLCAEFLKLSSGYLKSGLSEEAVKERVIARLAMIGHDIPEERTDAFLTELRDSVADIRSMVRDLSR